MKSAIVTGASGFVGSWLVKELVKHNYQVFAVVRNLHTADLLNCLDNVQLVQCDISDLFSLCDKIKQRGFDAFYHIAWIGAGGDARSNYELQIKNVLYCCDAVKVAKELQCKKILFAGTISEQLVPNIFNKNVVAKNEIYAICKKYAHYMSYTLSKTLNIEYVWMQFSNLFGPGSNNGNIVDYTLNNIICGKQASFGPAEQIYDLLYIEDLVNAVYLLGDYSQTKSFYYIGSGNSRPLKSFLYEIGDICESRNLISIGARPDDGTRYHEDWFNTSDLRLDVNFKPKFSFREGINKTFNYLQNK